MDSEQINALCLLQAQKLLTAAKQGGPLATKTKELSLTFTHEKDTKGTRRYSEEGDEPAVGKLYLKKEAAEQLDNADELTVTIRPS